MRTITLVIMEPGSDWPPLLHREEADVLAFGQLRGESDDFLLQRVCERMGRPGDRVTLAALACNSDIDDKALRRRVFLTRALLTRVQSTTRGRLLLTANAHASAPLRHELLGLAGALVETLGVGSACVSVRFGDPMLDGTAEFSEPSLDFRGEAGSVLPS